MLDAKGVYACLQVRTGYSVAPGLDDMKGV
jgi:hypothetical protein